MTFRSVALVAPFVAAVPVVFAAVILVWGFAFELWPFVAGAIGWAVALGLRTPVALIGSRVLGNEQRTRDAVVLSSGPLEEGVRLIVVLLVGRDLGTALWLGLGWAAIEVIYSLVNGFAVAAMLRRNDPEIEKAKALMPPTAFEPSAVYWGPIERVSATALHIGFTLITASQPILSVVNAVIHSTANYGAVALLRRYSMAIVQSLLLLTGAAVLLVGLLII